MTRQLHGAVSEDTGQGSRLLTIWLLAQELPWIFLALCDILAITGKFADFASVL